MFLFSTPKAFDLKAQGRAAHPGYALRGIQTPTGFHHRVRYNPVGVETTIEIRPQGALRDPGLCDITPLG